MPVLCFLSFGLHGSCDLLLWDGIWSGLFIHSVTRALVLFLSKDFFECAVVAVSVKTDNNTTTPGVFLFLFCFAVIIIQIFILKNRASLKIQFKYGNTHWISVCHKIGSHSIILIRENNLQTITEKVLYYLYLLIV